MFSIKAGLNQSQFHRVSSNVSLVCKLLFLSYLSVFSIKSFSSVNLVLAGGALKTCSSMSLNNCDPSASFDGFKKENLYEISQSSLQRLKSINQFESYFDKSLYSKIVGIYSDLGEVKLTKDELFDALNEKGFSNKDIRSLSDRNYFTLLDTLELFQIDSKGQRVVEQVSLENTKEAATLEIYSTFIEAAREKHEQKKRDKDDSLVTIGIVTASSRDPFEAVDFYTGAFNSPDIDVVWLPLTQTYQQARYINSLGGDGCNILTQLRAQNTLFDRERVYPKRTAIQKKWCDDPNIEIETLSKLDGIFFNGGDQSKTFAALTTPDGEDTVFLDTLRTFWQSDAIVIGGTSAGTAVQAGGYFNQRPVPMLTSGDSKGVLASGVYSTPAISQRCEDQATCNNRLLEDAVTIKASGGVGFFNYGLLDTHFSERDREVRLIAATAHSRQLFGFGVDETTALVVTSAPKASEMAFKVVGKGGVFIVDMTHGREELTYNGQATSQVIAGEVNFLPAGAQGRIQNNKLSVDFNIDAKNSLALTLAQNARSTQGVWRKQSAQLCDGKDDVLWEAHGNHHVLKRSKESKIEGFDYCGYSKVPFVIY